MNIEKFIIQDIKLFTKVQFFNSFRSILLNISKNNSIYQTYNSLFMFPKNDKNKINKSIYKKNFDDSYWFIIMKIIFDKLQNSEKNLFLKDNLKINPLVFSYLIKLSKEKIQKINKLSIKEKVSFNRLIILYLDLCEKALFEKTNKKGKKNKNMEISLEISNKYNSSKSLRVFSALKSKVKKKVNKIDYLSLYDISNYEHLEENDDSNIKKKFGQGKMKLSYNKSLSRLFIGETDEKSVKEKYLMNITVKKDQTIKLNGVNKTKAESYAKGLIEEINNKKGKYKGIIIDQNLEKIIDKFYKEQKILNEFKKYTTSLTKKKIGRNKVFNKTFQTFESNNLKVLHPSPSCNNFKTPSKTDNFKKILKDRKLINLKKSDGNTKKLITDNFKHPYYSERSKKLILKNSYSNYNIFNNKNTNPNKKIAKFLINRLKKYKNTYINQRRFECQNYMNKRDFYYNDEYVI